jgi:hypothetical protein
MRLRCVFLMIEIEDERAPFRVPETCRIGRRFEFTQGNSATSDIV